MIAWRIFENVATFLVKMNSQRRLNVWAVFAVTLQLPIYVFVIPFVLLYALHHFSPRKLEDKHCFLYTPPPRLAGNFPKVLKL